MSFPRSTARPGWKVLPSKMQGHEEMPTQFPVSSSVWPAGQPQPSAQTDDWTQSGKFAMLKHVRVHSFGQTWYTWPPSHGISAEEKKFLVIWENHNNTKFMYENMYGKFVYFDLDQY